MARIGYTIAPTAAPLNFRDIAAGIRGLLKPEAATRHLETSIGHYFDARFVFLVSSGKAAFSIILQALSALQPERKHVLIPAYTCYSVPASVARADLKIQLGDLGAGTLDFDRDHLDKIINRSHDWVDNPGNHGHSASSFSNCHTAPLAIVPTHLFGLTANTDYIKKVRNETATFIVEDAAQSMGGQRGSEKLGTIGDVSFFSLGRGKAITTAEGGIILTNNADIAARIERRLSKAGSYSIYDQIKLLAVCLALMVLLKPSFFWIPKALPFLRLGETIYEEDFEILHMSGFQAGLAHYWSNKLSCFKRIRRRNAKFWQMNLKDSRFRHLIPKSEVLPDLIRYPVLVEDRVFRRKVLEMSNKRGLGIMAGYPDAINHISEIRHLFRGTRYDNAEQIARMLITFPIHPLLSRTGKRKLLNAITAMKII